MNDVSKNEIRRRFSWKVRLSISFVLGLCCGVLVGFAISAPLFGWHLNDDASAVLSAFFGGAAGVAGAVLIWRLQGESQRRSIHHLTLVSLLNLRASAENAATGYGKVKEPMATFMCIDISLRDDLVAYAEMWSGLGVHQSAFGIYESLELVALKRHVDSLIREIQFIDQRRAGDQRPVEPNAMLARTLVRSISESADRVIQVLRQ